MGTIRESTSRAARLLEPENLIGRASFCSLQVQAPHVSGQHALLRWARGRWLIRDLGSRNGTFVDGARLGLGEEHPLREGTRIAFGKATDEPWEIVDDSPPVPMAVPLAGGPPVLAEGDMIALPSVDDPQATLYRDVRDGWVLERPDEPASRIPHLRSFEVAGTRWRFCCPNETYSTTFSLATHDLTLANVGAHFLVSSNEEHVTLRLQCGSRTIDMGSRAHNYLLLTLARARIKDEQAGHPDPVCGWVEHDEFAHDPSLAPPQLHLHVFRIRKHFASFGMVDAARVIERRPRQRQLRIGIRNLTITRH